MTETFLIQRITEVDPPMATEELTNEWLYFLRKRHDAAYGPCAQAIQICLDHLERLRINPELGRPPPRLP